ncbi:ATP-binding protein [Microtetraspora niveoalba]|uniref:ATP-binding protein n=1 Tax=Microtetraspora niveoalba TaxID=46175 RepID=UPI000836D32D|nr:ATP-binding protein [Microtetraspora niveoalba]
MSEDGVPPSVPGTAKELTFSLADLPDVREFAAVQARSQGMREDAVGDFVVALNEVATNAVTHGAEEARLRLWGDRDALVVDIHDEGREWRPEGPPGRAAPPENATRGMGLWVARKLSTDICIETGSNGTTVTMRFSV